MNKPKKILIDLGKLKNRYSGLGEVSYNFGKAITDNISLFHKENMEAYFLVPKSHVGIFGDEFKYVSLNFFRRHFPFLNYKYHLWYAIHQDSGYLPGNSTAKYVLTIHDLNIILKANKKKVAIRLMSLQKKINRASYITTISNFTKSEVQNYLDLKKIPTEVVYSGVINTQNSEAEKPTGIDKEEKFFFHISTLMPKKNVMVLLDMMKLIPDKKLVIAGSWESNYAKKIIQRIRHEKISNIITLSKINNKQKAWLFQNCDAFFFPSLQEGFGLPVIEAMYCGKPVFTSTCTSLPEIGGDKAFYWRTFEPEYMKNMVTEKIQSTKDDRDFANTLKQHAQHFTWQKNVTRYIALFKELLS